MRGLALPLAAMAAALALGGCGGTMEKLSEITPKASDFSVTGFDWNPYSRASAMSVPSTFRRPPLTPADYVNADGSCAATAPAEDSGLPVSGAVALTMSECNVVHILGAPEKIDIGANERNERAVKLLYSRGDRPGLYYFTAGRLTQIERVAEPPPPPKQRAPAKPRRAAS